MKRIIILLLLIALLTNSVAAASVSQFSDLDPAAWYYSAIDYTIQKGIFNGMSDTTFAPDIPITRAQFVAVLARMNGADISSFSAPRFVDVPPSAWYAPYVNWANAYGLVYGTGKWFFSPDTPITREDIVTILHRYAALTGNDITTSDVRFLTFSDYSTVSAYAQAAMQWAVSVKIVNGTGNNELRPQAYATRAQIAMILQAAQDILVSAEFAVDPSPAPDANQLKCLDYIRTAATVVKNGMSQRAAYEAIHDYVCDYLNYDWTYSIDTVIGAFYNRRGTCYAYTCMTIAICEYVGLECEYISGYGNGGSHAWCRVKIDGIWYYSDPCWDGCYDETYHTYLLSQGLWADHILQG